MTVQIHAAVDHGVKAGTPGFAGGTLVCKCTTDPVKVTVESDALFNHVCGCSQCWRPTGSLFAMIAVAPTDKVKVVANGQKLKVVDPSKTIQRNACTVCGVHMHGPISNPKHAFNGLTFIHAERFDKGGWSPPGFAAFVSSLIETGTKPEDMEAIRARLKELKLEPYDALSPQLMDLLAANNVKVNGVAKPAAS
jgi:S-(hydroxymethyl)glutathione synthase